MVVLTRKMTKKETSQKLKGLNRIGKKFESDKFCGKVKFEEDGLDIQKRLRSEWE